MNDNLIGREYPDGSRVTFVFDSLGQTTTMEDSTGSYTSTYDSISRKTTVTNPANKTITYAYDALGQRSSMIEPDGGRFTYLYNADGQLETLVNPQSDRTTYSYNAQGRRESILLANGTRTSFVYDANSQMANVIHRKSDNTVINSFAYNYDPNGNRTSIAEADGCKTTYTYDAINQLESEHRTGSNAHRTTFTYDTSGNRIKQERDAVLTRYEYDNANQLTAQIDASGRTTYTFDATGNQEVVLAPNGDLTTTTWDYENQPTVYEKPDNSLVTMIYNADNRRVGKESTTLETKFIWEPESDNILLETDDFDTTQVVYTNEPSQYGSLISQYRNSTTNWYHPDALGSIRELTNSSETITDNYTYDAWGNIVSSTGTTVNPFQFVGEYGYYYDVELGSLSVRRRVLEPVIARWISADPMGFVDGLNMYLYANNNSMNLIDPSGMFFGWGYGKYCGYSRRATCPPGSGARPDDALDAACERHDCCHSTIWTCNPYHLVKCNIKLCSESIFAYRTGCSQSYPNNAPKRKKCKKAAKEVEALFCAPWGVSRFIPYWIDS